MKSLLNSHNFGKEELLQYCFYLQNYCVNEINDRAKGPQNQNYYRNEYLTWVDFKAANGLLLVRGYIPHTDFKNFISCSLKCLPLNAARAQNFYSQQVAHLELTFAAETAAFCQANIWFSEGKYKKCYDLLLKHQFADPFNKTDAKILEIKALYELNETDPFESVLNNAIRYLFRLKMLPAARLTALKNMLNFLKRMYETDPANQKRLRAMKTQLLGMTVVADKDWLLEKITDLII
ncbi:MAG TPA: hypothetical protein ENJ82_06730 [Bacteroidetes bacterium]|nr:hypothetical protein [Bacteroidota bacterium]